MPEVAKAALFGFGQSPGMAGGLIFLERGIIRRMGNFLEVFSKVAIMLLMMAVGWVAARKGMLTEQGSSEITRLLLEIVTPCLIVNSFLSSPSGAASGFSMLLAFLLSFLAIGLAIGLSFCFFRKQPENRQPVLRFAIIFSNAGFMGLPLVQGILGNDGVIYASFFVAVFNFLCWTYGYSLMNQGAKLKLRNVLLNPGTVGLAIGLPLYLLGVQLPGILAVPVKSFADLNTPLAMLVVGGHIAKVRFRELLWDRDVYVAVFARLLLAPALLLAALCLIRPEYNLFVSTTIQASAPSAANGALFAAIYGKDAKLASKTVAAATLLSALTIPLMTVAAQFLASALC